jgi:putative CocE/NonD family hydrolase
MRLTCLFSLLFSFLSSYSQDHEKFETIIIIKDSITLATDIYKPKGAGAWPVILIRTPYNKDQNQADGIYFASKGYVVVIQDVRGKYKSSGVFIPFLNEVEDGKLTIDWIIKQPWSNKQIGYYGTSYGGFCGLSLSDGKHPALKAIFNNSGWLTNQKVIEEGGATNLLLGIPWTYTFTRTNTMRRPNLRFDSLLKILPVPNILNGFGFNDWWRDLNTLLQVNRNFRYQNVKLPIMHITGWFDFTMKGTMDFYERVSKYKHAEQKLVIGPWTHGQINFSDSTKVGAEDLGPEAAYGINKLREEALNWFDHHLKSAQPLSKKNELFVLFENKWISIDKPIQGKPKRLYLSSEKGANSKTGDGKLVLDKSSKMRYDTFTYDPLKPVPTNGGANFHFFPNYLGIRDQRNLQSRRDLLVYISEPAESNTVVLGNPSIDLSITSSAATTDFTVKLFIVDDNSGSRKLITDAIKRVGPMDKKYKPGEVYKITVDLGHTAFSVKKGQRVGIEITGSNFPKFERNLNTVEKFADASKAKPAHQKVYHSKPYPSSLTLPILQNTNN